MSGGISKYVIVTVGNVIIFGSCRKTISFSVQKVVGGRFHIYFKMLIMLKVELVDSNWSFFSISTVVDTVR